MQCLSLIEPALRLLRSPRPKQRLCDREPPCGASPTPTSSARCPVRSSPRSPMPSHRLLRVLRCRSCRRSCRAVRRMSQVRKTPKHPASGIFICAGHECCWCTVRCNHTARFALYLLAYYLLHYRCIVHAGWWISSDMILE